MKAVVNPPVFENRKWEQNVVPASLDTYDVPEDPKDKSGGYTVYIPKGWKAGRDISVRMHFHTAGWLISQEAVATGLDGPLVVWNRSGASSAYRVPFEDKERIFRILVKVVELAGKYGAPEGAKIGRIDITSFSAGYGAVREIIKNPAIFKLIRRVVLCDSIYASLEPGLKERRAKTEDVEAWFPLAKAAVRGEKEFLMSFSEVPTSYASTSECGARIAEEVGGVFWPVPTPPPVRPVLDEYRCTQRLDMGGLHLWQYPGSDGTCHVRHVWNLDRLWKALDGR